VRLQIAMHNANQFVDIAMVLLSWHVMKSSLVITLLMR